MAALAFFAAVAGGTAYGVATIGSADIKKDAVLSRHIHDGAVKNADLGANSVGTGKVINDSLTGKDINESQLGTVPNANELGGLTASEFKRASFFHYGSGLQEPGGEDVIIRWDAIHAAVTTNDDTHVNQVRIVNTLSGPDEAANYLWLTTSSGGIKALGPQKDYAEDVTFQKTFHIMSNRYTDTPLRTWVVTCSIQYAFGTGPIVCQGTANGPA
jgi:hypothetical protein